MVNKVSIEKKKERKRKKKNLEIVVTLMSRAGPAPFSPMPLLRLADAGQQHSIYR